MNFDEVRMPRETFSPLAGGPDPEASATVKDLLSQLGAIYKETRYELLTIREALNGRGEPSSLNAAIEEPENATPPMIIVLKRLIDGAKANYETIAEIRGVLW